MINVSCYFPNNNTVSQQLEERQSKKSSLLSRFSFTLNWEGVLFVNHAAVLTAAIASAFFLQLPLLALGVGVFGFLYINGKSSSSNSNQQAYELRSKLDACKNKNENLEDELQNYLVKQGFSKEEVAKTREEIKDIGKQRATVTAARRRLKVKRAELNDRIRALKKRISELQRY